MASAVLLAATPAVGLDAGGIIDTLAGGGIGDGFPADVASVDPDTVSVGPDGSIYIAESSRHRIRRIDPDSGFIETLAGIGSEGFSGDNGQATVARLKYPTSAAADAAGNVYIADQTNHRIRRVAPNGIITTVAGTGVSGYADGPAGSAKFYFPRSVSVDASGNVLIAEPFNQRIRYLNVSNNTVTTVAGTGQGGFSNDNGPATEAKLQLPSGVFSISPGVFLIADQGNHRVRKVQNGTITTVAGSGTAGYAGDGGQAKNARLSYPTSVAQRGDGSFVIADQSNNRIRLVNGSGVISTVAGTGTAGYNGDAISGSQAQVNRPSGVAFTHGNDCLIADLDNERVRWLDNCAANGTITTLAGISENFRGDGWPALVAVLEGPSDAIEDVHGNVYIADSSDNRVRRISASGVIETLAGTGQPGYADGPAAQAMFKQPQRVEFDSQGNLLVLDTGNRRVRRINLSDMRVTTVAGNGDWGQGGDNGPATSASFMFPLGLAVDSIGRIYVADASARRIRVIHNGTISAFAGNGVATGAIDGPGGNPIDNLGDLGAALAATFIAPSDLAIDSTGAVYVTDMTAHLLRKIDANGVIRTLAGTGVGTGRIDGAGGNPDDNLGDNGPAADASFNTPMGVDTFGSEIYIADQANRRIRVIGGNGIINTIGGNGVVTWSQDGEGGIASDDLGDGSAVRNATFMSLSSVFVNAQGAALVADSQAARVRAVAGSGGPPPTATPSYTKTPTWTSAPSTPTGVWTPTRTNTPVSANGAISGRISYYSNNSIAIPAVDVSLTGPSPQTPRTNSSGNYSATNLPGGSWRIQPSKQGSIGNAVSSLDAARVLQVIAGMTTFTPLQRLACDATGDGSLSSIDAVRILQLSAGVIDQLPAAQMCQSDWLFYPEPAIVPNQQIVLPLVDNSCRPGAVVLASLQSPVSNQNFEAILLGDCTGNWTQSSGGALRKTAGNGPTVHAGTPRRMPGGRVRLPIYTQAGADFQALDVKLSFTARALTLLSVRPLGDAVEAITTSNDDEPGVVAVSLASARPIDASGGVLMLEFAGDERTADLQLISAQVDERRARVVTH